MNVIVYEKTRKNVDYALDEAIIMKEKARSLGI